MCITTRLDYCNSLYLSISKSSIARLQLVQNAAAKFLKGQRKFDRVTPILKLLPVHFRIEFKIILYVFKSINNLAPIYLINFIHTIPLEIWGLMIKDFSLSPDHG